MLCVGMCISSENTYPKQLDILLLQSTFFIEASDAYLATLLTFSYLQ